MYIFVSIAVLLFRLHATVWAREGTKVDGRRNQVYCNTPHSSSRAGGSLLSVTCRQCLASCPVVAQQCGQPGTELPVHCVHSPPAARMPITPPREVRSLGEPHAEPAAERLKLLLQSHMLSL